MESFLSIVGSIASIFGAWWALQEAKKSKAWANRAEQIHNELVHRRRLTEVAQVHSETKRVLSVVARIGPSCSQQQAKGVNSADIAKEVEGYVRLVLEQCNHFSNIFGNQAVALCDDLKDDIEELAKAKAVEDKMRFGKSIYYKIQNFMPIVKQLSDDKREHAKTS